MDREELYPAMAPTDKDAWQDIKTAPLDGTEVLIYSPSEGQKVARYIDIGSFRRKDFEWIYATHVGGDFNDYMEVFEPTHWQPLSEDPKD